MAATPKIVQLLKALPEKEFRRFKVYLQSPFFNKNPKLIQLLKARKSEGEDLEILQKKIFPKTEMSKQVFKNLSSALLKHYERFLAHLQLEDDEPLTKILAAEKAATWGKSEVVLAVSPKIELEEIGRFSFMAIQLLPRCFNRQVEASYRLGDHEKCSSRSTLKTEELLNKIAFILAFLYIVQTRQSFEYRNNDYPKLVPGLLKSFELRDQLDLVPLTSIYREVVGLLVSPKKEGYFTLKEFFFKEVNRLHPQHSSEIAIHLNNFCVLKVESGNNDFVFEYLEIQKITLENNIGDRTNTRIRNIIIFACNLKQFAFANKILEDYKSYLDKGNYSFLLSLLHFYQGNLSESLNLINQVSSPHLIKRLSFRQLTLSIHLLREDIEFVSSFYEATRQIIERSSTAISHKNILPAKIYLKYFHKILKVRQQKEATSRSAYQESLQKLKEEIQAVDKILSRNQLVFIIEKLLEQ